eukprot:8670129-Alexandrium_andersonii.AAC.1
MHGFRVSGSMGLQHVRRGWVFVCLGLGMLVRLWGRGCAGRLGNLGCTKISGITNNCNAWGFGQCRA